MGQLARARALVAQPIPAMLAIILCLLVLSSACASGARAAPGSGHLGNHPPSSPAAATPGTPHHGEHFHAPQAPPGSGELFLPVLSIVLNSEFDRVSYRINILFLISVGRFYIATKKFHWWRNPL